METVTISKKEYRDLKRAKARLDVLSNVRKPDITQYSNSAHEVPTYHLKGKAAILHDKMVEKSLQEYREGKTIRADSIDEALRMYAKKNKKS